MKFILHFGVSFMVFIAVDLVWLGFIAKNLYANALGHLMSSKVNWTAALIFYVLFVIGLLYFVIEPALKDQNMTRLIISAALFGFMTYATYDLTNLATLKEWPLYITLIDLAWGTTLSTVVSLISYIILRRIGL